MPGKQRRSRRENETNVAVNELVMEAERVLNVSLSHPFIWRKYLLEMEFPLLLCVQFVF